MGGTLSETKVGGFIGMGYIVAERAKKLIVVPFLAHNSQ